MKRGERFSSPNKNDGVDVEMSSSVLPTGWERHRVLITGSRNEFTIHLRHPIKDVVFAHVRSMEGAACVVQIAGLNHHHLSSLLDHGTRTYHTEYCGNNLSSQLTRAIPDPPLPSSVTGTRILSELSVRLINIDGTLFSVSSAVNIELDIFSYC